MSRTETEQVVHRFNAAIVDHDPAPLAALVGENCVMEAVQPAPDGQRYEGRTACLEFWQAMASDRTTQFEPERFDIGDGHAAILWRFRYGPGRTDHVRGVTVMTIADGKITEALGYSKTPGAQALPLPTE
jgi:ketosteroid isomerase-like protein